MERGPRVIVSRTNHLGVAENASAYLNERFPGVGAIVERSYCKTDCQYRVLCCNHRPYQVYGDAAIIEACRAYITAAEAVGEKQ